VDAGFSKHDVFGRSHTRVMAGLVPVSLLLSAIKMSMPTASAGMTSQPKIVEL
jgi:hypothetical protein